MYLNDGGDDWDDNEGWMSADGHCSWSGITCNEFSSITDINLEEKKDNIRESDKAKRDRKLYRARGKKVDQVKRQTYGDLSKNEKKVLKKIRYKEEQSKKEFAHKTKVLKSSFNENSE